MKGKSHAIARIQRRDVIVQEQRLLPFDGRLRPSRPGRAATVSPTLHLWAVRVGDGSVRAEMLQDPLWGRLAVLYDRSFVCALPSVHVLAPVADWRRASIIRLL